MVDHESTSRSLVAGVSIRDSRWTPHLSYTDCTVLCCSVLLCASFRLSSITRVHLFSCTPFIHENNILSHLSQQPLAHPAFHTSLVHSVLSSSLWPENMFSQTPVSDLHRNSLLHFSTSKCTSIILMSSSCSVVCFLWVTAVHFQTIYLLVRGRTVKAWNICKWSPNRFDASLMTSIQIQEIRIFRWSSLKENEIFCQLFPR